MIAKPLGVEAGVDPKRLYMYNGARTERIV